MLQRWFILVGILAMEGVFSYKDQPLDECPTFDDQGSLPNINDVSPEPRFEMEMSDIENGYITNGTYDMRIKANNPFHYFTKVILAFENLDNTCENVSLVPRFDNFRYLNHCEGVMVSDQPMKTTKLLFEWKAPSCGCLILKAKVYEGSSEQPTTLTPIKVCPDIEDLDEYLNDLLDEVSPDFAEDDLDDFAISSEEEEISREEVEDNIVDHPHRGSAVKNPKGLCREFKISRGSGMSSLTRRRWRRCCQKTGAGIRGCIAKTVPPRKRINLRMRSVCRVMDLTTVTSASINFRRCCNSRTASKRAHCFQGVKFQKIDNYCEGQVRIPFSSWKSASLLSSNESSPCCSMKGRHRYSCFNHIFGESRPNNKLELSRKDAAEIFCARVEEKGETISGSKYCCNKLNEQDKVTCIGKLVRAGYDAKCNSSTEESDLFQTVRSKSVDEVWRRIESATRWRVTDRRCCLKDTVEGRYRCLAQKHRDIRIILNDTRSSNTHDNDLTSVSGTVSENSAQEDYSGDLAPEVFSGDLTPAVLLGDLSSEVYTEELESELIAYSPTPRIKQGSNARSCHAKTVRRIRHKLRVLNRICRKPQSLSGERQTLSTNMRRCCVVKPERRFACLQLDQEEQFSDICRGEITPLAMRHSLNRDNPCCQKAVSERPCCFNDHLSSQQQILGRRPPVLVNLLRLKSDPRGMRELRRMDILCQDVAEKSKAEMWGRHNIFKCCHNDGSLKYTCLLQVFRSYTDKACSGKRLPIKYEIGKFGEIPPSLPKDFLSPNHTCCQFEDRERYECVLNRGFNRSDVGIDVSGSIDQEHVGKGFEGEVETDTQQHICTRVKSYQSEGFFEVLEIVQGVVRSFVEQHGQKDEEEFDDEFDTPLEKDRHGHDEVTTGRSSEEEDDYLEQKKKGGSKKSMEDI